MKKNPKNEYAKVLMKLAFVVPHVWTDQQKKTFNTALLKHGRDCKAIWKYFPTLSYNQIEVHAGTLTR